MCDGCHKLIKAIDEYIEKADADLAGVLEDEGFIKPKKTVKYISELEDGVTTVLEMETAFILQNIDAKDLKQFSKKNWPNIKQNDKIKEALKPVFIEKFQKMVPTLTEHYIKRVDDELRLERLSKPTIAWVESWSEELASIMKLNSYKEIETILIRGLEEGIGIDEFTRHIMESGIRDERYRARTVAVTEVLRAHSVAQQEAFIQSPSVSEKMWRHTGEYRNAPRENHVEMDGQRTAVNEPFILVGINGGVYYPMHPRDPILPPEEAINCHCIMEPVVDEKVLGFSLEERKEMQRKALEELDDNWEAELDAQNKAKAGIEAI